MMRPLHWIRVWCLEPGCPAGNPKKALHSTVNAEPFRIEAFRCGVNPTHHRFGVDRVDSVESLQA